MIRITRRMFLTGCAASAAAPLFSQTASGNDRNLIALLADPHLSGQGYSAYTCAAYQKVVREILAMSPRPANAVLFGDFAWDRGLDVDYERAKPLTDPLEAAGIRVTIGMGNHDRRGAFLQHYPSYLKTTKVPGRIVSIVETPNVDMIMLDSCLEGPVEGAIDPPQKEWLRETLKAYKKPVLVCAHHHPEELGLGSVLAGRPQVAGFIHGHLHYWKISGPALPAPGGGRLRTLGLPSTGLWGDIGHAILRTTPRNASVELIQTDYYDPRPKPKEKRPRGWDERVKANRGKTFSFPLPPVRV